MEIMYSKYGMEVEVEARTMEKMNSSYEALTVKPEDMNTVLLTALMRLDLDISGTRAARDLFLQP